MKTYRGDRTIDGLEITVDGAPLDERYDLERFTKAGFEWGYEGDASRQLALAILADHTGDDARARALSKAFMEHTVAALENEWQLTGEQIDQAIAEIS